MSAALLNDLKRKKSDRDVLRTEIKRARILLQPQPHFNENYVEKLSEIVKKDADKNKLKQDVKRLKHQGRGLPGQWDESSEADKLRTQFFALQNQSRILDEHVERLKAEPQNLATRSRAFLQSFISSSLGLNQLLSMPKRNISAMKRKQQKMRADSIKAYNAAHPDPREDLIWCPIMKKFLNRDMMTAAHIFPYGSGKDVMKSIFDIDQDELMSPHNCLIMVTSAERLFDKGVLSIIPAKDVSTEAKLIEWRNAKPLRYKLKIMSQHEDLIVRPIAGDPNDWYDYDGKELVFRSEFRPRSRYLFFQYACTILSLSYKNKQLTAAHREQFGTPYWGTGGSWMKPAHLKAFVNEVGAIYAGGLGDQDDGGDPDATALIVANGTIAGGKPRVIDDGPINDDVVDDSDDSSDEDDALYEGEGEWNGEDDGEDWGGFSD